MTLPSASPGIHSGEPVADTRHTLTLENSTLDERWAAWQARGVAHDAAVRRKAWIVAPVVIVAGAACAALFAR